MGGDYKRVTNVPIGAYGEAALEEALKALQHGESYRNVEREYDVPSRLRHAAQILRTVAERNSTHGV